MKCPKCQGEDLTSDVLPHCVSDRWSLDYDIKCLDCLNVWVENKVIFPSITPEVEKHWANVEDPFARYAREALEREEKMDRDECPMCGGLLVNKARDSDWRIDSVYYVAVCRKCKWGYSSTVSRDRWIEMCKKTAERSSK